MTSSMEGVLVGGLIAGRSSYGIVFKKQLATTGDWQLLAAKIGQSDAYLDERKHSLIIVTNFSTNGMILFLATTLLDGHFWMTQHKVRLREVMVNHISGEIRIWSKDYLCERVTDIVIEFDRIGKDTMKPPLKGQYIVLFCAKATSFVPVFDLWIDMMFDKKQSKGDFGGKLISLLQSDNLYGMIIPSHEFNKFIVSTTGIVCYADHFPHWCDVSGDDGTFKKIEDNFH